MDHTIKKLNDEHWVVDGIDVVYFNTFGREGWYISKGDQETPIIKTKFVHAIECAMGESETKKQVMAPPAGM